MRKVFTHMCHVAFPLSRVRKEADIVLSTYFNQVGMHIGRWAQ